VTDGETAVASFTQIYRLATPLRDSVGL